MLPHVLPHIKFWRAPPAHALNTCGKPCIYGNLALLSTSGNFWSILELFILTGVLSIELFCYTTLDFLLLLLPRTYSASFDCSRYNAWSTSNSTDIRASKELSYLSWFNVVLLVLLKYKILVSRIPWVFVFSGCLMASFTQLESTLPHYFCLFMFNCLGIY